MKRWSVRRVLVGLVAIAVSVGARHADAQVMQAAGAPMMMRAPIPDENQDTMIRVAPRQWRPVVTVAPNVQAWRNFLSTQRRQNIARLRAYMQAGVFPENRVRPGRLNVFVDGNGRLCAVANLLAQSGHRVLVDRVSRANNFVRFADVATGPLVDWALSSGLTREEIIRIQEPYEYIPQGIPAPNEWQAQQQERVRLQSHFVQVIQELEASFDGSVALAVNRLGVHVAEAPRDLGWEGVAEPIPQPYVQPVVQPVVYPQPYVQPYAQPVVVYPEPVLRPVRVNPYSQPVVYPTPQPVVIPVQPVQIVQPVQPLQVHVNVNVQANPGFVQPVPVVIAE